jgi:antitoxin (DNA-binding transcriptional repressor) of toxin-antitoxin stability system
MTKIELKKASEPLSKYAQKARKDPVIVVKKGKLFAAVVPIRNNEEIRQKSSLSPFTASFFQRLP